MTYAPTALAIGVLAFLISLPASAGPAPAIPDEDCLVCHAGAGEEDAPKLDLSNYRMSVHVDASCVGCHPDVLDPNLRHEEEDQDLGPASCLGCHEERVDELSASIHGTADPSDARPSCATCHGDHAITRITDPSSPVHRLRQGQTCGECHDPTRHAAGHDTDVAPAVRDELSVREQAQIARLEGSGALVAAACSDCHGAHAVYPREIEASTLSPAHALDTCQKCHEDEADDFEESIHYEVFAHPDRRSPSAEAEAPGGPPLCIDCHPMHSGHRPRSAKFREDLVHECGSCHEHLMETYLESYHGKATLLGRDSVAKCSDCHGYHGIRGPDDPDSMVSPERKLETCQQCHPGTPPAFAGFWAHADHDDSDRFPVLYWVYRFMTTLLVSVLTFFGLHTLLWGVRELIDAVRMRGQPVLRHKGRRIRRFTRTDRILHFFVATSFLGLAATGAPLKLAGASWAAPMLRLFGGAETAGHIHRFFAIITFGYFFAHIVQLAVRLWPTVKDRSFFKTLFGPDSLIPRVQDVIDVVKHFGWFLGLAKKPTWDRWTYWEKFDYWAVFWGVAVIGSSGLILWFPGAFARILPGWAVNVALVIHSDEALLAIAFIFGVHFFNSHLRRAKFPMDEVIFTGSLHEEEMREERGREVERIGTLDDRVVVDPHPVFRAAARVFGISAWLTGLVILGLIIHGFLTQ